MAVISDVDMLPSVEPPDDDEDDDEQPAANARKAVEAMSGRGRGIGCSPGAWRDAVSRAGRTTAAIRDSPENEHPV
jgi:hypothetical protein